eukprot:COSAG06_NODE_1496_length_9275_cov_20.266783_4_plen_46_part_00
MRPVWIQGGELFFHLKAMGKVSCQQMICLFFVAGGGGSPFSDASN